ncbi:sugar ABC transporter permease [Paenibacillus sp. HWE-109]|uniref:carbohydrate ABC transporter permease n=1 Tax=Paenibacillus sp. HWE-109 TaxID=1306526 RepID=UPI001EDF0C0F|nr:sugar ABC transporter permease [Paenibacillus sp. HWE-109]UKS28786.1 sugar ABC transporter permease [Paenibacillus sp. HWE-109]
MKTNWMKRQQLAGYLFVAPSVLGILIFFALPALYSLWLSFFDWQFTSKTRDFIGFGNYTHLLQDEKFYSAMLQTLKFLLAVPISIGLAFAVAAVLNDSVYFKKLLRAMFFLPYITSGVAIAFVWMLLFHPQKGPINQFLHSLGVTNPPEWLASTDMAMAAIDVIWIWFLLGYNMIIYLAALQDIPSELLEASSIEGATVWQRIWHIVVPLVSPTTLFLLVTGFIVTIKQFGIIEAITQGGPGNSTMVLSLFIYKTAFRYYEMGYASAASWILFSFIFVLTLLQWVLQKRWVHD